jgi:hypothetical protein
MARSDPRANRLVAQFSLSGEGTASSPASLHFTLSFTPSLETIREKLPDTVTADYDGGGCIIRGVNPTTSRDDLRHAFYTLCQSMNWLHKHHP